MHLNFDTKPGSAPDGAPTHPDFARLPRESWLAAVQDVCEERNVAVIGLDGQSQTVDGSTLGTAVGGFLVDVLLQSRDAGTFAGLPKAERCELGVEDPTTGEFGWPAYDDRGKTNLIQ